MCFKVKQQNIFGLALIETGNLVHSAMVSGAFCESIRGKISSPLDHRVGTADGQSEGLQKITDWALRKTGKEVAMFLGIPGYYQTFIPQYSVLTNLLKGIKKAEKFL